MKDLTNGKLDESLRFAESIGDTTLKACIDRLKYDEQHYSSQPVANVFTDHYPHCFYFELVSGERMVLNGGIKFHGMNGELQNGSVQIEPSGGWQIHT